MEMRFNSGSIGERMMLGELRLAYFDISGGAVLVAYKGLQFRT
jgi:hypothetical protein